MRDEPLSSEALDLRARLCVAGAGRFDDRRGVVPIGVISLSERVAVWDPSDPAGKATVDAPCRQEPHEVVALEAGRLELEAVVVRRPGAAVARWCALDVEIDDHAVLGPADAVHVAYPGPGDSAARDARAWVHLGDLPDGRHFLWIEDPTGCGGVRASVGLDRDGVMAAVLVEIGG